MSLRSWQVVVLLPATFTMGLTAGVFGDWATRSCRASIANPAAVRDDFHETRWVAGHIVRTIATTAAFGCLAWALVLRGRATADTADTADHEETRPAQTLGSP
jgi:hypothetical protein